MAIGNYTITIGGQSTQIKAGSLNIDNSYNERSTVRMIVQEAANSGFYQKGQSVLIVDNTVSKNVFKGVVDSVASRWQPGGTLIAHTISCADCHYFADKRIAIANYSGLTAGDIVCDLGNKYLIPEGIDVKAAFKREASSSDFSLGTLSNLAANAANNDLELTPSGTSVLASYSSGANWDTGTYTNTAKAGNNLQLASASAIQFSATCNGLQNTAQLAKQTIWTGSQAIGSGYFLQYDVFIPDSNPAAMAAIDLTFNDGTHMKDSNGPVVTDQNGYRLAGNTDLTPFKDQWYTRYIDLNQWNGKSISSVYIDLEATQAGNYTIFFKNIIIRSQASGTILTIFSNSLAANNFLANSGYHGISCSVVTAYQSTGTWLSPATSVSALGLFNNGSLFSTSLIPSGTSVSIQTSIDGGLTWQSLASDGQSIQGLVPGMTATSRTMQVKITLSITGNNPLITPVIYGMNYALYPSYMPTVAKTDQFKSWATSTDWNTGTKTNTAVNADNSLSLATTVNNWDDGSTSNQSLFGPGTPVQYVSSVDGLCKLQNLNSSDTRIKFTSPGSFASFVASVDVIIPPINNFDACIIYRTTAWNNSGSTFAYIAGIYCDSSGNFFARFGKGSNSTSGTFTSISQPSIAGLSGRVTLTLVVTSSNVHTLYINGAQVISTTDTTFTSAGNIGLRFWNGNTNNQMCSFDNFTFYSTSTTLPTSGSWKSAALPLTSLGTYLNSVIEFSEVFSTITQDYYTADPSLTIQASWDGGSTWNTCTSGQAIPGITAGTSLSGKTLTIQALWMTYSTGYNPKLSAISLFVASSFSASGTRISPAIALDAAIRDGNSSVTWASTVPANTSATVQTSINGGSTWQSATSGTSIANLLERPNPGYIDGFAADSSSQFTQLSGTWLWDVANSRLKSTAIGQLTYNGYTTFSDGLIQWDSDSLESFGPILNYVNSSNYYYLSASDTGANSNPGSISLKKVASGVTTTLTTATTSIDRTTPHRWKLEKDNAVFKLYLDAYLILSYTDTGLLGAGKFGFQQSTNGESHILNMRIQPYGQLTAGISALTKVTLTSTDPTATPSIASITVSCRNECIETGPIINTAVFNYTSLSSCFDSICKQCGDFWWNIDENGRFWFQSRTAVYSPVLITQSTIMDDSNSQSTDNNPNYHNTDYVVNVQNVTSTQYYMRLGDGTTKQWLMSYPLYSAPTIKVNGVIQTVGVKGTDTGKSFYWAYNDPTITYDDSLAILVASQKLEIWYLGLFDYVAVSSSQSEIISRAAIEGQGTGINENVLDGTGIFNSSTAFQLGASDLQRYAVVGDTLTFNTQQYGFAPGQLVNSFLAAYNFIDQQFIISKVSIREDGVNLIYQVEATSGPIDDSYTKMFGNVLANETVVDTINVGQGQTNSISNSTSEGMTWAESVTETPFACPLVSTITFVGSSCIVC